MIICMSRVLRTQLRTCSRYCRIKSIAQKEERNEEQDRKGEAAHHHGVVELLDPPDRAVVHGGPKPFERRSGQQRQADPVEQGIEKIGDAGEEGRAEEIGGQIHSEQKHQQTERSD